MNRATAKYFTMVAAVYLVLGAILFIFHLFAHP